MKTIRSLSFLVFLLLIAPVFSEAHAHSLFNSAEETLGSYRVQVATFPEFPQIGEPSQILFRVTDLNLDEVDKFTMGVRFFYNGQQIDSIPPKSYTGGHFEMNYVWENPGNHVVRVDLYDMGGESGILTYTFNMGTQSPFGFIFIMAIIIGAMTMGVVVTYVYFPEILKFKSKL